MNDQTDVRGTHGATHDDLIGGDVSYWYGSIPNGCDVPHWVAFMTPDELDTPLPKLVLEQPVCPATDTNQAA